MTVRTAFLPSKTRDKPSLGHSEYFTFEELKFLSTIFSDARPLATEQIEIDKRTISRELSDLGEMCKLHAQYLLKAITFWEMYYEDKYEEWTQKFVEVHTARSARLRLASGCDGSACVA